MNRYKRQHRSANVSPFIYFILVAMAIGVMIWRISSCNDKVQELHKAETGQQ